MIESEHSNHLKDRRTKSIVFRYASGTPCLHAIWWCLPTLTLVLAMTFFGQRVTNKLRTIRILKKMLASSYFSCPLLFVSCHVSLCLCHKVHAQAMLIKDEINGAESSQPPHTSRGLFKSAVTI